MIAAYQRISHSDNDLGRDGKDKSNSIENQRELIRRYLESFEEFKNIPVVDFVDDGYTGTNFERPGFQKMMDGLKDGTFDTVIVKDLSRFGRDYIGVGEYMEQIFPLLNIRFIAVNDNYDSKRYIGTTMSLDVAVSNLVNTMYCRDTGKKLHSANTVKWKKGISTATAPPFGYRFDPNKKGHLVIDPPAAKIVRRIFDLALLGIKSREIAFMLNDEGLPPPSVYNTEHQIEGKQTQYTLAPKIIWDSGRVWRVLNTYEYTGALVMGKSRVLLSGKKLTRSVPKGQRYVTEGTHEAIVTHEEYDKALQVIRQQNRGPYINSPEFALRKKIRCGNCRRAMAYYFGQAEAIAYCSEGVEMAMQTECSSEQYKISDIENVAFQALQKELSLLDKLSDGIKQEEQDLKKLTQKLEHRRQQLEQNVRTCKAEKMRLYEEFAAGILELETYKQRKDELDSKIGIYQKGLDSLDEESRMNAQSIVPSEVKAAAKQAETFLKEKRLTANMVSAFIENIYVYSGKRIEVCFKFEDAIRSAAHELHIEWGQSCPYYNTGGQCNNMDN